MKVTYENVARWFDGYFKACNQNMGPLETVKNLEKYFTPDLQFWMYTAPGYVKSPLTREGLLMLMVHPGLHEELTPQYYAIDVKRMINVVQFQIQFSDQTTGRLWAPTQASCHYHLTLDEDNDLKIKKIQYWVEVSPPEEVKLLFELWDKYRDEAVGKKR